MYFFSAREGAAPLENFMDGFAHFEVTSNVGSSMPSHLAETEALHLGKGSALFLLLFARASANGFQRRPLHVSGDALRTKSGSGTVSVNLSPPSFVEAELTRRT